MVASISPRRIFSNASACGIVRQYVIADDIALISRAKNRVASLTQRFEPNAFAAPENVPEPHITHQTFYWFGELDPLSGTPDRSFGEVQQDLLLFCLTIGQAYCLLEVLKWIPHIRRWRE